MLFSMIQGKAVSFFFYTEMNIAFVTEKVSFLIAFSMLTPFSFFVSVQLRHMVNSVILDFTKWSGFFYSKF